MSNVRCDRIHRIAFISSLSSVYLQAASAVVPRVRFSKSPVLLPQMVCGWPGVPAHHSRDCQKVTVPG